MRSKSKWQRPKGFRCLRIAARPSGHRAAFGVVLGGGAGEAADPVLGAGVVGRRAAAVGIDDGAAADAIGSSGWSCLLALAAEDFMR